VPIDWVVFDLGNVLIEWDRRLLFEKLIDDPNDLDRFLDEVLTLGVNADLDRGVSLADVTEALAGAHPGDRVLIEAFRDRWPETLGEIMDDSVEILDELAGSSVTLLALTNWGSDTFAVAEPHLPFLDRFHGVVISGREGLVKPDPAIFDLLCVRYEVVPERAVFIDDGEANIVAATGIGFHTVHFRTADQCRAELISLGLDLVADPS
jgi:2-haloacid dehalogenase